MSWVNKGKAVRRIVVLSLCGLVALAALAVAAASFMVDAEESDDVGSLLKVEAVSAGALHTCVLLDDGMVKCWGNGKFGQLGQGDRETIGGASREMGNRLLPVDLGTGRNAIQVSAGAFHTCVLLDNGRVKCWGRGRWGQLGQGDRETIGGASGEMGDRLLPVDLGTGRNAIQVSAGGTHTCALLDNGAVKCWGANGRGQLGQGHMRHVGGKKNEMGDALVAIDLGTNHSVTQVSSGGAHTCALLDNGAVKCWGANGRGQLGQGTLIDVGAQAGEMGDHLPTIDLGLGHKASQISTGSRHTCVLLDNDSVKCWGDGGWGQLGQGHAKSLGGRPNEMGDHLRAIDFGLRDKVSQINAGANHTCVLWDDGGIKCWGRGSYGQLGQGDTESLGGQRNEMGDFLPIINLGAAHRTRLISAGGGHTCALLENRTVKCWGLGYSGQLGQGSYVNLGDDTGEMGDKLAPINLGIEGRKR